MARADSDRDKRNSVDGRRPEDIVSARWLCGLAIVASLAGADPRIVSLRVEPGGRTLQSAGAHQRLLALARYEDGTESDLTERVHWTVSNPAVAKNEPGGMIYSIVDEPVTNDAALDGSYVQ